MQPGTRTYIGRRRKVYSGTVHPTLTMPDLFGRSNSAHGVSTVEKVRIACIESDGGISALTNRETDRHRAAAAGEEKKTE